MAALTVKHGVHSPVGFQSVENLLSAFLNFELLTSLTEFDEAMFTQKELEDTSILDSPFFARPPLPLCLKRVH